VKLRRSDSTGKLRRVRREMQRVVARMKDAVSGKEFERAVELREEEILLREELEMLERTRVSRTSGNVTVTRADIEDVVSSWTGVPVTALKEDEAERLRQMEEILGERVVGQQDGLRALARSIRRSRLGVTNPNRPVGSFIFLGPSGVGKTEVARQLARFLFQDPSRLVRFDMSEYMEKHTVSRLIGSPPGYVGFEEGGQLSERLRHNPYSVVLLDEIEKAHPDIYNLLLQVLEDGRLTDNYGNLVDFTNSIIIMTSNLGSRSLVDGARVGFSEGTGPMGRGEINGIISRELKRHFPPEFLNRLDDVIVFQSLDEDSLFKVAALLLEESADNLRRSEIELQFPPELPAWLVGRAGVDPHAGARPLRRVLQRWVEDAVADYLIEHRVQKPRLRVVLRDDRPVIEEMAAVTQGRESL